MEIEAFRALLQHTLREHIGNGRGPRLGPPLPPDIKGYVQEQAALLDEVMHRREGNNAVLRRCADADAPRGYCQGHLLRTFDDLVQRAQGLNPPSPMLLTHAALVASVQAAEATVQAWYAACATGRYERIHQALVAEVALSKEFSTLYKKTLIRYGFHLYD